MFRIVALLLAVVLLSAGCTEPPSGPYGGPSPDRSYAHDETSAAEALREVAGVIEVDDSGESWTVGVDPSLDAEQLGETATALFEVWNDTEFDERPTLTASVDGFDGEVQFDPRGGGRPFSPPALGWAAVIRDLPDVERAAADETRLRVRLADGTDTAQWAHLLAEHDLTSLPEPGHASIGTADEASTAITLAPGDPLSLTILDATGEVAAETGVRLTTFEKYSSGPGDLAIAAPDVDAARAFADALIARYETDDLPLQGATLAISVDGAAYWSADLEELPGILESQGGLPELIAATGATLRSSYGEDSISLGVPGPRELEKVIELLRSDQWTPGRDSNVSIHMGDEKNASSLSAGNWGRHGALLVAALDAGMENTRITSGRGGRRTRDFDISFRNSDGIDFTSPEGYQLIIDLMRGHDWVGLAQIEVGEGDHLIFWSTATGEAEDPYFSLHDAESREIHGWAVDLVDAWNASAG